MLNKRCVCVWHWKGSSMEKSDNVSQINTDQPQNVINYSPFQWNLTPPPCGHNESIMFVLYHSITVYIFPNDECAETHKMLLLLCKKVHTIQKR